MGMYSTPPIPRENSVCNSCKHFNENEKYFVIYCPCYDQCGLLQYCDKFNAQYYMKETPIIDNINSPNIRIDRRLCNFVKKCF